MLSTDSPLRFYLAVLRRRFALIAAFVVVLPVAAYVLSSARTPVFQATSSVLINRQSLANQLSGTSDVGLQQQSFQQVLLTQTSLATTPSVIRDALRRASKKAKAPSESEFRSNSDVRADNDLLTFSVKNESPESAKVLSSGYANAFVAYRLRLDSTALTRALADLSRAIDTARASGGPGAAALQTRLMASRQELETRLALQTSNAQLVAAPDHATKVSPRPLLSAAVGLLLGLVLGIITAAIREVFDTRVRTSTEVEDGLGLAILGRLSRPRVRAGDSDLVMVTGRQSVQAEGFRILRTNLAFGIRSSGAKILMVTSSSQGEGKSTTVANLAVASALAGQSVAVVDLDLRRPRLASLFELPTTPGLTGVAIGTSTLEDAMVDFDLASDRTASDGGRLRLLQAGALPPDPAEFVSTQAVREVLMTLRDNHDLVLVDAPPINAVSDASSIAEHVDGVFVCARLGVVRRPLLRLLRQTLERVGVPVLGLVITDASLDSDQSYQSGYGYGYAAAPSEGRAPVDGMPSGERVTETRAASPSDDR